MRARRAVLRLVDKPSVKASHIAQTALLSFLDMDEAGKERLAKAMYIGIKEPNPSGAALAWNHEDRETRDFYIGHIDAVLQELRKMAGEK